MRALAWSVCLATALAAAGCAGPTVARSPDDAYRVRVGPLPTDLPSDAATVTDASVEGDVLRLQVRYGGGCREHDFALYAPGVFMESHPVQTRLTLSHDAHGDVCRALLERELRFDLTPLREAYRSAYGDRGPLVLHLQAPGAPQAPSHTLTYTF